MSKTQDEERPICPKCRRKMLFGNNDFGEPIFECPWCLTIEDRDEDIEYEVVDIDNPEKVSK